VPSLRNGQMAEITDILAYPSFRPSVGLATFNSRCSQDDCACFHCM